MKRTLRVCGAAVLLTAALVVGVGSFRTAVLRAQRSLPSQANPTEITCVVTISTATTIQAVGGSCAAPGAGLSIYLTDILFATNAGAIAADTFNTLKSGTGGTCGTATAVVWGAMTAAATQTTVIQSFARPIKIAANSEVCWINSTAGSKFLTLTGYIAP